MIVFGTRNTKRTVDTGTFACPHCGVDRPYHRLRVRRFGHVFFVPLVPLGEAQEIVRCDECNSNFRPEVLSAPTATQFADELNRAVQLLVMTAVAADIADRPVRAESARSFLASRGWTAEQIDAAVNWSLAAEADMAAELPDQLFRQLAAVAGGIELAGREQLLMSFGWILASDGSFSPADAALVAAAGQASGLTAAHVQGILTTIEQSARPAS